MGRAVEFPKPIVTFRWVSMSSSMLRIKYTTFRDLNSNQAAMGTRIQGRVRTSRIANQDICRGYRRSVMSEKLTHCLPLPNVTYTRSMRLMPSQSVQKNARSMLSL